VGPRGRSGYQQFPTQTDQNQQGIADPSQMTDLGTTPKVKIQYYANATARASPTWTQS